MKPLFPPGAAKIVRGSTLKDASAFNSSALDFHSVETSTKELLHLLSLLCVLRQTPTVSELVASRQCDIGLAAYAVGPDGTEYQIFTEAP